MTYTAGFEVLNGFSAVGLVVVWLMALGFGVYQYGQSKGRIGRAVMSFIGAGLIGMILLNPSVLTTDLPGVFKNLWDWVFGIFNKGVTPPTS